MMSSALVTSNSRSAGRRASKCVSAPAIPVAEGEGARKRESREFPHQHVSNNIGCRATNHPHLLSFHFVERRAHMDRTPAGVRSGADGSAQSQFLPNEDIRRFLRRRGGTGQTSRPPVRKTGPFLRPSGSGVCSSTSPQKTPHNASRMQTARVSRIGGHKRDPGGLHARRAASACASMSTRDDLVAPAGCRC
jgi:hypothetical protein